jgi:hypothetical protein
MREKPNVQEGEIAACLNAHYGLQIASVNFLPIGRDLKAWVYQVIAENRTSYPTYSRVAAVESVTARRKADRCVHPSS